MGVSFIGLPLWLQVSEPEWTKPGWDISKASILYRGPRPLKTAFENTVFDFEPMPGYPGMRLQEWTSRNITPNFPGVEKMYVGFLRGVPPPKGTASLSAQTVRVSGVNTVTGEKVSATIAYRASRTMWEWWETAIPGDTPRYQTVINQTDPRNQIDYIQVETADGSTTTTFSDIGTIINNAVPEIIISDYVPEPIIPGAIWRCSATIDYKIRGS